MKFGKINQINKLTLIIIAVSLTITFVKCANKEAHAQFSSTKIDFGVKSNSDTLTGQFVIENAGDENLIIQSIETDCGCTIPKYSKSPIKKGEKRKIAFTYIPKINDIGEINKQIVVKTNSTERLQLINFHVSLTK